jgi:hypothetical protein
MNSRKRHLQRELSLKGISTTRKHLYFYLLLFLGTVVLHNIWRSMNEQPSLADNPDYRQLQEVATTAKTFAQ